jgi:hypothetical protein
MENDQGLLLGEGRVFASFPSGKTVGMVGKLYLGKVPNSDEVSPVIVAEANSYFVLDPRAVVTVGGTIKYHPRVFETHVPPWVGDWLKENANWAPVGRFKGVERPGSLVKGTRIRKAVFERGDGHRVGALGTVSDAIVTPDGQCLYTVVWDDNPSSPIQCLGHKIERA